MPSKSLSLLSSFRFAFRGIILSLKQRNMRIHFLAVFAVCCTAAAVHATPSEWAILILTITFVLVAETINTAVETLTDLHTSQYHPLAEKTKDLTAGAVLLTAICAVIIALIIFIPAFKRAGDSLNPLWLIGTAAAFLTSILISIKRTRKDEGKRHE